jgi:hypothetical protein
MTVYISNVVLERERTWNTTKMMVTTVMAIHSPNVCHDLEMPLELKTPKRGRNCTNVGAKYTAGSNSHK